jgi:hypothetical protein
MNEPARPAPIRIEIPPAPPPPPSPAQRAAAVTIAAIREAGIDPRKAADVPMIRQLVAEWLHGRQSRATFIDCCRKVAILNPSLLA